MVSPAGSGYCRYSISQSCPRSSHIMNNGCAISGSPRTSCTLSHRESGSASLLQKVQWIRISVSAGHITLDVVHLVESLIEPAGRSLRFRWDLIGIHSEVGKLRLAPRTVISWSILPLTFEANAGLVVLVEQYDRRDTEVRSRIALIDTQRNAVPFAPREATRWQTEYRPFSPPVRCGTAAETCLSRPLVVRSPRRIEHRRVLQQRGGFSLRSVTVS